MEELLVLAPGAEVPLSEVELRASRSSGPGGQHANVTASRVEAVLDVAASRRLTPAQKERLIDRLGPRPRGVAQDARSQSRNRELAIERLRARLSEALREPEPRRPTRSPRSADRRRLEGKRRTSARKAERRRPDAGEG